MGLRMDWGPQYTAQHFLGELAWLGIRVPSGRVSPSYVGEPECNGVRETERRCRTFPAKMSELAGRNGPTNGPTSAA